MDIRSVKVPLSEIITRYMDDQEFQNVAFPILAKEIFEAIRAKDEVKS